MQYSVLDVVEDLPSGLRFSSTPTIHFASEAFISSIRYVPSAR